MSSKLCEIHERRLPISPSPMRSLSLMRQRVMPRLLHQSDNHPLVCEMFLIHPSCFFDDGRTPAPSCPRVLALDQSSYELFFLLAIVLERVSESLIVLSIAREMHCWNGRLKSLWLYQRPPYPSFESQKLAQKGRTSPNPAGQFCVGRIWPGFGLCAVSLPLIIDVHGA